MKKFWLALLFLALLSPLGLLIPDYFSAGAAWGEWSPDEIQKMLGYLPGKMAQTADIWQAPFPDYARPSTEDSSPLLQKSIDYIFAAFVGLFLCWVLGSLAGKFAMKRYSE